MPENLHAEGRPDLEGLCEGAPADRIRLGCGCAGIERLEARLGGQAFSPHRHDTYAIGVTLFGVQSFTYRGRQRHCLPGQLHVLHPDELHDGGAATPGGFGYRIAYVDPSLIQQALGRRSLPFVADPAVADAPALPRGLWRLEEAMDNAFRVEAVVAIADLLDRASGNAALRGGTMPLAGLGRVRDLIAGDPAVQLPMAMLETVSGLDRWTLARGFRAAFGTSPSRFRTMRQLDRVRASIGAGLPLVEAALAAGFADQSHMTRQFKRAYGLTPARWAAASRRS